VAGEPALRSIALSLGSDIPYFLGQGSAVATGRGEHLEYFRLTVPYWIVMAYPNTHVSTAWAYGRVRPGERPALPGLKEILTTGIGDPQVLRRDLVNDFESVVFPVHPGIAGVKERLLGGGALYASMSGSGSSVFGLFRGEQLAEEAARGEAGRGYIVSVTPPGFEAG
jgi:4-diphosphocytidyl-2-C-methyl-D-erythritol kinase